MICYFDTPAIVALLVIEPGTPRASRLWQQASRAVSSELLYVEAAAALAQAKRMDRLDPPAYQVALDQLDELYADLHLIHVEERLIRRAAVLAADLALRGYDAVHCASAERLVADDVVVVTADSALLRGCRKLGLSTADTAEV
ncbi:MAG: type II toxin-antitoxin system VapC family toxin [Pseudonocardiales bacterium]|nr:type II toxin-antitoxin system VapC family toxin [Pseudonocardiales bacterium]